MDVNKLIADIFRPNAPQRRKDILDLSAVPSADAVAGRLPPEAAATDPTTAENLEAYIRGALPGTLGERVAPVLGGLADYGDPTEFLTNLGLVPDMVEEWFTPDAPAPTLPSQDEWISSRRKPIPTYAEYEAAALDKVRNSKPYADAVASNMRTTARKMLDDEAKRAKTNYEADKALIEAQNASLSGDYKKVAADYDRDLEAYYGRSFADRNPITARQLPIMGAVGAGLVTKGLLNKVRKPFNEAVEALQNARKGSDPYAIREAEEAVKAVTPSRLKTGGAVAAGAAVPVEIQMLADVIDAKGLDKEYQDSEGNWQPALAQKRAADRLNIVENPREFIGNNSVAILSGLLGAYGGSKFAAPLRKVPAEPSQDDVRRAGDDIIAREAERARVAKATQPQQQPQLPNAPSGPSGPATLPGPPQGPAAPTSSLPNRQSSPRRQPSKGPRYTSGSPDQIKVQQIIDDLLTNRQPVTDPAALVSAVKASGSAPTLGSVNLANRAAKTAKEARSLESLGVDLYDPAIRKAIIDKIAPGAAGLLSVGGMANADIEALLAEIMGGGR